jgi:hypothetical protein
MAPKTKRNGKIDEEVEETFPASDPPAFMAGNLGAPKGRKSARPAKTKKRKPAVTKARPKKVKKKKAATKRRKAR